jgi:5'-phosphate synthase pdxT subunit
MKIGVIGLQGAVDEHLYATRAAMQALGIRGEVAWVSNLAQLAGIDGVIIPGGESTTIGKLMQRTGLFERVRELGLGGTPIFGTCAGMILLAKQGGEQVERTGQPLLGLMDMEVVRNAFGRQRESFETDLNIPLLGGAPFKAVFIRAPIARRVWGDARVIAEFNGRIVGVLHRSCLAVAFHPELTGDMRLHAYFLGMCKR